MKQYWIDHIDNLTSFYYNFRISVSSEDYIDKILEIDSIFLKSGYKYGIFTLNDLKSIDLYLERRKKHFLSETRKWISFLDFEQIENTTIDNMFINVPNSEGKLDLIPIHQPFVNLRLIEFANYSNKHWSELKDMSFWYEELSFSIYSNSNIWWEEIDTLYDEHGKGAKDLKTPIDNRIISYNITPRFNSFLRDISVKVEKLGGKVILEEHDSRFVTKKGIFLDGKIQFQEDLSPYGS